MPDSTIRSLAAAAYGRMLRSIYAGRGQPWAVHDEIVRIDPRARHLVPHHGEPALFHFLKQTIRPGDVVLDVGAFVGIYAVLAARWSGANGRVIAFEPTPSSAALARRHLSFNGFGDERVHLIEAAASDRQARAAFHRYDATGMPFVNSLAAAVDTDARADTCDVAVVTLDDVCRELKVVPSVIRMDVQGAEIHALRGARDLLRQARPRSVVVEMHPQCWPAFGITEADVRSTLRDLGLTARPLVAGEALFARDSHAVLEMSA
jgi:FkbM family methyltransferase